MPNAVHPVQQLLIAMDVLPMEGEHFSNNNNQNTLWQLRDRLFQVLFERAAIAYASTVSYTFRRIIEFIILKSAVTSLFILIYLHYGFVRPPANCLEEASKTWSREGILRVELSLEEPSRKAFNINNTLASHLTKIQQDNKNYAASTNGKSDHEHLGKVSEIKEERSTTDDLDAEKSPVFINRTIPFKDSVSDPDCFSPVKATVSEVELLNSAWPQEQYIIEYSLEYGYLRLSAGARQNSSVNVHTVILDPYKDQCFGNDFSRFLLKYVVGYGDLLMASLKNLVDKDENKGFVRNVVSGDQYRFIDKSNDSTSYFSAAFFMMCFTISISVLLRYSHHQIFLFVVELLHVFEMNSLNFPAAPLLTVILALVGMEAIMSEYFNDSVTAFYIIIIIWVADQYDSICCRTTLSKRHWLRFFYLYHFAFYAYHYRFNGQYSFLALSTSWLFIQHSMIYCFHHYELPLVWRAYIAESQSDSDASYHTNNHMAVEYAPIPEENAENEAQNSEPQSPDLVHDGQNSTTPTSSSSDLPSNVRSGCENNVLKRNGSMAPCDISSNIDS